MRKRIKLSIIAAMIFIFSLININIVKAADIDNIYADDTYSEYGLFKYKMITGGINTYDGTIFYDSEEHINELENILLSRGYILFNTDDTTIDDDIRNTIINTERFSYSDYLDRNKTFYWNKPLYIPSDWYITFINCDEDDKPYILDDLSMLAVIIDRQVITDRQLSGTEGLVDKDIPDGMPTASITFTSRDDCDLYFWGGIQLRQYHIHINAGETKTVKLIQDVYVLKEINGQKIEDKDYVLINDDSSIPDNEIEVKYDFDVDKTISEIEEDNSYIIDKKDDKDILTKVSDSVKNATENNNTLQILITLILLLIIIIIVLIFLYEHKLDKDEEKQDKRDLENTKDSKI